jgi:hypothetical protein
MSASQKNQGNREAIRIMVADLGYTETAARTGLKRDRLYKWGQRYGWNTPVSHSQAIVQTVQSPSDGHARALAEMETETRISLARSVRRMSRDAESATLRDVDKVHKAAQTMAIVHRQGEHGNQAGFTLNVLNLGSLGIQVRQDEETAG